MSDLLENNQFIKLNRNPHDFWYLIFPFLCLLFMAYAYNMGWEIGVIYLPIGGLALALVVLGFASNGYFGAEVIYGKIDSFKLLGLTLLISIMISAALFFLLTTKVIPGFPSLQTCASGYYLNLDTNQCVLGVSPTVQTGMSALEYFWAYSLFAIELEVLFFSSALLPTFISLTRNSAVIALFSLIAGILFLVFMHSYFAAGIAFFITGIFALFRISDKEIEKPILRILTGLLIVSFLVAAFHIPGFETYSDWLKLVVFSGALFFLGSIICIIPYIENTLPIRLFLLTFDGTIIALSVGVALYWVPIAFAVYALIIVFLYMIRNPKTGKIESTQQAQENMLLTPDPRMKFG